MTRWAAVAFGANLGDREAAMIGARAALEKASEIRGVAASSLYETAPVGGPDGQDAFLNAAATFETTLEPNALLDLLQSIEADHLRTRDVRWGPRTLDLDILLFGDAVIETPRLTVPHPRMHERRFVLAPLAEVAPDVAHPTRARTISELLHALPSDDVADVVRLTRPWRSP